MIKDFVIADVVLLLGTLCLFVWACYKVASNADKELGYDYVTKEDKEVM